MNSVNTVLGPITPDDLGKTLMHEHILFGFPGWYGDVTLAPFNRAAATRAVVDTLEQVRACGVKTIVDATPNDAGRAPEYLAEVSAAAGVNIVCSTGFYFEGRGASAYFNWRRGWGNAQAEIHEMLMAELTEGIAGTGIKAGAIKVASSQGAITDYEQMFFRAAAQAQRETGVPIITHTEGGTMGPEQAALLIAEGADPSRIMVGHMGDNVDRRYQMRTLEQGVYVAFDRMGLQGLGSIPLDTERYACILELVGMGYAKQIMLSHDAILHWLGRPPVVAEPRRWYVADWHPTHLFRDVIPALRAGGVAEAHIDTILVDNPRRLFSGQ